MKQVINFIVFIVATWHINAQVPQYVPSSNLRAWWSFSGDAQDASGNNINGTINGALLTQDMHDQPNSAYIFNGVNNWIDLGDNDLLNPHFSDWTVSAWIKTTSDYSRIFSKGSHGGSQPGYTIMIYPGSGGRAALIFGIDGYEHIVKSDSPVNDDNWHMITGVISRSDTIIIYIDGVEQNEKLFIGDHSGSDLANNTYNAAIGVSYSFMGTPNFLVEYFNGKIDEVGVWSMVLNQCEILDLYNERSRDTSITETECDSFTAPDGTVYTTSGIYTAVIQNATGCDSTITIDLTINYSNTGTDIITACDSYTWIDGVTYTVSNNTATYTLTNVADCDSIVTLDLTINYSNTGTDIITACDSYTWIDGVTYTVSNNTATYTLTNVADCDSIVTLDLTINYSNTGTDIITACDSYTWIDGVTYTVSNNTATYTLTNVADCDSIVTLDLTINYSNTGTDIITACDSYTWIDGVTYTVSNNTATYTLTNVADCDSLVTLNLTIIIVNTAVTVNGLTITADADEAIYQWLECPAMTVISGETNQSFTATANGNYAVEVTENGCVDTSVCVSITSVGIYENSFGNGLLLYPNPTDGNFSIDLGDNYESVTITITDLTGKLILSKTYIESQVLNLNLDEPVGAYLLIIESGGKKAVIRIVKE
ncbi:MAG: T9SS type A sorting domain-containing protein [Bacteroidales bacterium]|nr:T9SS type A sorting domain-containing protein [Bacteroidales bacterium]